MRILGLIAIYSVALFLTGWLLLDVESKSAGAEVQFSPIEAPVETNLLLNDKDPTAQSDDLRSFWQDWLQRPIGVVCYPDFPPINFLPNGD